MSQPIRIRALVLASAAALIAFGVWWLSSSSLLDDASTASTDRRPYESFPSDATMLRTPSAYPEMESDGTLKPVEAGLGTAEDPHARMRFEWMRLRDPRTGEIPKGIREAEMAFAKTLPRHMSKSLTWEQRGPVNVGGRTRALAYDVSDPTYNTILAAGVSGGIWRTTDGGATWTRTLALDQRPSITSLAQDTRSGQTDVWYASTGERRGNSAGAGGDAFYRGNGVYKSTDGGLTWSVLPSTTGEPTQFDSVFDYSWRVRTDPSNTTEDEVYVAVSSGIVRSVDGGQSWSLALGGSAVYPEVEVTSTGVVYATLSQAGATSGLYRSTDGTSWTNITPSGFPASDADRTTIGVNPSNEDEVWFVSNAPGNGPAGDQGQGPAIDHVLWKYDASTDTWRDFSDYLPTRGDGDVPTVGGASGDYNTQGAYDIFVNVHPDDGSKIFVGGRNLWRIDTTATAGSADTWIGGYTETNASFAIYQPAGSDRQHPDQHVLAFRPDDGNVMLTGSDGGVHRTLDNTTGGDGDVLYESLNDGYFTTQFYHTCMNSDPADLTIMGGMQDNGTWFTQSPDVTDDWTEQLGGDGAYCEITNAVTRDGTARYPSFQLGQATRFDYDASGTLTNAIFIYPTAATGILFIHPFEIDPVKQNVMYYPGGTSMWRTQNVESNAGITWEEIPNAAATGHIITALDASTSDSSHVLYYGTVDTNGGQGRVYRLASADTVSTGNASPTDVTGTGFPTGGYVNDIAVDPADSDNVLVAFSNYNVVSLFYTDDGGQTWTDVEGNLAGNSLGSGGNNGPSIRSVAILPQPGLSQTTFYVGTSVGMYSTTLLAGSSTAWAQEGPNDIGNVVVADIDARTEDGQILVGTHANGVFSAAAPIPVELARFDAVTRGQDVEISWETLSETNNAEFRVEHRYRDGAFATLHRTPGAGTTRDPQRYNFRASDLPPGPHTFRLRQVDVDGTATLSEERSITLSPAGTYDLTEAAPNPFQSSTRLRLTVRETQPVTVSVYNTIGQRVRTLFDAEVRADDPIDLTFDAQGLSSGLYVLQVKGETFVTTRKTTLVR